MKSGNIRGAIGLEADGAIEVGGATGLEWSD